MNGILDELTHPAVRDLAGVMDTPGLMSGIRPEMLSDVECAREIAAHRGELLELDRDPSRLMAWLEAANGFPLLGRYFEALLGFWIQELKKPQRFAAGIKVLRDRATVGELDFVFQPEAGHVTHWEASVKFYLCTAAAPGDALQASTFIGTMTKDRLDLKMRKLLEKQLLMVHLPEARKQLQDLGFEGEVESRVLFKGALFYPAERDWRHHPHPPEISPHHRRGWWAKSLPMEPGPHSRWVVLERRRWLSPFWARAGGDFAPLTHAEMSELARAHFAEHRMALMLAEVRRQGDLWLEHERGLLVHQGWPWRVIP